MSQLTNTQISSSQLTDGVEEDSFGKLSHNKKPANSLMKHSLLSISILVLTFFGVYRSVLYEESIAKSWTVADITKIPIPSEYKNLTKLTPSEERDRLLSQLSIIENRENKFSRMTQDYYKWLFATIISFCISTIIASICLFYITKEGWKKANNYVINVFTVFFSIALLSGSLRLVFKLEDNAQNKLNLLIDYVNLKNQTLTNIATMKTLDGKPITLTDIVNRTEKELLKKNDISIMLDTKNLPNNQSFSNNLDPKQGN